jgi:hypothetical protein
VRRQAYPTPAAMRSALLLRGADGPERKRGVGLISRRGGPWFVKAALSDLDDSTSQPDRRAEPVDAGR